MELEKLEKLFDLSQDFICITSTDGYFKRVNPIFTKRLGYSEKSLLNTSFMELIHKDDLDATILETEKLSKGENTLDFVNRYRKKDGGYITLNWLATIDKNAEEIFAIARDITDTVKILNDLKKSRAVTEKALKAKDEFLTNMSHEIRTPLNAVIGFNDLLQHTSLNDDQSKYVSTINIASQNLMVIINDILDSAKLESGNVQLEDKVISLKEIAEHVILLQSNGAKSKNIKLLLSVDMELPEFVIGDHTRLMQILVNLTNNAIKFTDEGYVELKLIVNSINNDSANIRFSVKDTGIGIAQKKIDSIFDRFVQAENSTSRIYGGTGLGLNIVKMLIELYKGKLEVQSKMDVGSEFAFEIDFPISDGNQSIVSINEISDTILKGYKILIVEDNEHNQFLAKTYLEKKEAYTEIAENGELAIQKIKHNDYDIVLMDLQMPNMDGYTATEVIRKELKLAIPIIGCSAHSLVGEKEKCLEVGMNDYIAKPYSERTLIYTVVHCLSLDSSSILETISSENDLKSDNFTEIMNEMRKLEGEDFVQSMVSIFKRRIPNNISELEQSIENKDLVSLKNTAHLLAGSFSSMNFTKGNKLAKKIENYSINKQENDAFENAEHLISYLNQALKTLNI